jgi:hypothetical protein
VAARTYGRQGVGLVERRLPRSPDRVGLARNLGDESIRKLS